MGHHVQNIETLDTYLRQIMRPTVFQSHLQVSFHQPLAQMPRPEAIGGKLFTREMHEPDVTAQLTFSTQFKKYRGTQHKSSSGGVIVIGAGSRQAWPLASGCFLIMIFHVRGVVMIRHDHGPAASAAGYDHDDIPLMRGRSL